MADKILIVDDDPAICKLLEKVMHSNEMETSTVNCINVFGALCFRDTDGITATCNCTADIFFPVRGIQTINSDYSFASSVIDRP